MGPGAFGVPGREYTGGIPVVVIGPLTQGGLVMQAEQVTMNFTGYRWDGTVEGAQAIASALSRWYTAWEVTIGGAMNSHDPIPVARRRLRLLLMISNSAPRFDLDDGDTLVCEDHNGAPWPLRVISDKDRSPSGE